MVNKNSKGFAFGTMLIIGSLWRRWFGGGFGRAGNITRGVKYLALLGIIFLSYWFKGIFDLSNWEMYIVCLAFAIHWAVGHGTWFCYWDTSSSAEGRLPLLDKFIFWCIGEENSRTFWGNFFGMFVRYTITAIPVAAITSWWFLLAGLLTALCYVPAGIKKSVALGEFLSGAVNFMLLFLCI